MKRLFTVCSLFAICLCLSCFTGVKQAGAFSSDALLTQDVKVKYGGTAMVVNPTWVHYGIANKVKDSIFTQTATQCGNVCHTQELEGVIDASRRLKDGDGTMYHGSGDPTEEKVDPTSPYLMVAHNLGNNGSKAHASG